MADLTPEQQLTAKIEAKFGSLERFGVWLDAAAARMDLAQAEAELQALKDAQQASRQEIEVGIQAKQAEFDAEIKALRQAQQADFDKWQVLIDEKQAQIQSM